LTEPLLTRRPISWAPYNAESDPLALVEPITTHGAHYVRSNFRVPDLSAADYRLSLDGAVERACTLDLAALRALPWVERTVTMECAGNDRLGLQPLPAGEPWGSGAIGTARWGGVRLRDVLALAGGVLFDASELVFTAADAGPRADAEGTVRFARSLPRDEVDRADPLLALTMNGEPLAPAHGAPVRLVVPGWYGMANVKWLVGITAVREAFAGYFQQRRYVYDTANGTRPVARMRVKAGITAPREGEVRTTGPLTVRGWAWSGDGAITRVEVAVGGGDDWLPAALGMPADSAAWTPWQLTIPSVHAGRLVLRARAHDASGAVQPEVVAWNRLGYGNHAVRPVVVEVRDSTGDASAG
jgi:DMSO/TMAO reductase YedYZ molybdopterin-dependent catalytic subunit